MFPELLVESNDLGEFDRNGLGITVRYIFRVVYP